MKAIAQILFLLLSFSLQAKMLIVSGDDCKGICTQNKSQNQRIQKFQVIESSSQKSLAKGFEITLNELHVIVDILDKDGDQSPLLNIKDTDLYAVHATSGSAGRYYHYFKYTKDKFYYLGFYPELIQTNENKFKSYEKDGPRNIETQYQLKNNKIELISQEVI